MSNKRLNLGPTSVVSFDLEATSKDANEARIFEIAAVANGLNFHAFVNPGMEIPDDVKELCKLDDEDLDKIKTALTFKVVAADFIRFIENATRGSSRIILVAHNAKRYDLPLLELESIRHGVAFRPGGNVVVVDSLELFDDGRVWEDTVGGKPARLNLEYVFRHVSGGKLPDAHSAAGDVKGLIQILRIVDPGLKKAKKYNHFSPLSYDGVDLSTLDALEQKVAQDSLRREVFSASTHPILKSASKCQALLDCIPSNKLLQGVDGMSSEAAKAFGCIEIAGQGSYPRTERNGRTICYHQIACAANDGCKPLAESDDWLDQFTASHICQNDRCINRKHLKWETLRVNLSRIGCYGIIWWNRSATSMTRECKHVPRCGNCIPVTTSVEELSALLNDHQI